MTKNRSEQWLTNRLGKVRAQPKKPSKYHNERGDGFDSKQERGRYDELQLLEQAGVIRDLRRQVEFLLVPRQEIDGKFAEHPVRYKADFVYIVAATDNQVVEDSKGHVTPDYVIRRKLMLKVHGIRVVEVGRRKRRKGKRKDQL